MKQSKSDFSDQVSVKLSMGDVRGAVNLVSSQESILPPSEDTKQKLQSKHPASAHLDYQRKISKQGENRTGYVVTT